MGYFMNTVESAYDRFASDPPYLEQMCRINASWLACTRRSSHIIVQTVLHSFQFFDVEVLAYTTEIENARAELPYLKEARRDL